MSELDVIQDAPEVDTVGLESAEPAEVESAEAESTEQLAEPETGEEPVASEEPEKPKRRSRAEERINALTREKYEAQKAAETAQRQAVEMQQYIQQQMQSQPQQADMPKLSDYDFDEGRYNQAVQAWHQSQMESYQANQQVQMQEAQRQQAISKENQVLQQKIAEGTSKYPDFAAKVYDPSLPPLREINPAAFQAVIDSDVDVAYYLANNPAEVYAFASMNPVQAIKTVAALEQKLGQKPAAAPKLPPKPPSRVKGNSESVEDPRKMSTDDWMKWRNKQLQNKR